MRTLLVMRHGKSLWPDDEEMADVDRPLSKRGKREARQMARALAQRHEVPDLLVCSPAKRARATAKRVAKAWPFEVSTVVHESLYGGGVAACRDALVGLPDGARRAMVIGHNPALEDLIRMLTGRWVTLKTSTVARIDLDIASWEEMEYLPAGNLVYVLGVEHLASNGSAAEIPQQ